MDIQILWIKTILRKLIFYIAISSENQLRNKNPTLFFRSSPKHSCLSSSVIMTANNLAPPTIKNILDIIDFSKINNIAK